MNTEARSANGMPANLPACLPPSCDVDFCLQQIAIENKIVVLELPTPSIQ